MLEESQGAKMQYSKKKQGSLTGMVHLDGGGQNNSATEIPQIGAEICVVGG